VTAVLRGLHGASAPVTRRLAMAALVLVVGGCGLKGPLQRPQPADNVVIRPAPSEAPAEPPPQSPPGSGGTAHD